MNESNQDAEKPFQQMTLRDYFAAQALNGLMSANWDVCERRSAEIAYAYADCMLEAREKKP